MPKKPRKSPTYKDAEFARDMVESREDEREFKRKVNRWRLDIEKMKDDWLKKKKGLERIDPNRPRPPIA